MYPNLLKFAAWCVQNSAFDGTDLDGADVQEKALEYGIIVETAYDPARHGENWVDAKPGDQWFEFNPVLVCQDA